MDGIDLWYYQLEAQCNQIGIVDQDIFVFNRSIADNIRFGKSDANQHETEEAAQIVHAHDFIMDSLTVMKLWWETEAIGCSGGLNFCVERGTLAG